MTSILDPYQPPPDGWEFCNITPGRVLRAGHSGICKIAKGL